MPYATAIPSGKCPFWAMSSFLSSMEIKKHKTVDFLEDTDLQYGCGQVTDPVVDPFLFQSSSKKKPVLQYTTVVCPTGWWEDA